VGRLSEARMRIRPGTPGYAFPVSKTPPRRPPNNAHASTTTAKPLGNEKCQRHMSQRDIFCRVQASFRRSGSFIFLDHAAGNRTGVSSFLPLKECGHFRSATGSEPSICGVGSEPDFLRGFKSGKWSTRSCSGMGTRITRGTTGRGQKAGKASMVSIDIFAMHWLP